MTEHRYLEKRDRALCDFCCAAEGAVHFVGSGEPLELLNVFTNLGPAKVSEKSTDWSACARCARVARRGDPLKLAVSVIRRMPSAKASDRATRLLLKKSLTKLYTTVLPRLDLENPKVETHQDMGVLTATGTKEQVAFIRRGREALHEAMDNRQE